MDNIYISFAQFKRFFYWRAQDIEWSIAYKRSFFEPEQSVADEFYKKSQL